MVLTIKDQSYRKLQIAQMIGGAFFILFLVAISPWLLLLICLLPLLLCFQLGVQIDTVKGVYRRYTGFIRKKGEWKSLGSFHSVVVKPFKGKKRLNSISTQAVGFYASSGAHEYSAYNHEVYLMNESQGRRLFIGTYKNKLKAKAFAGELAKHLNIKVEPFKIQKPRKGRRR